MSNVVSIDPESRFVGNWKCCDAFSDITFNIVASEGSFVVSVTDSESSLLPEVFDTVYEPASRTLKFSVHWASTGRFTKYSLIPSPVNGRVDVTFTYTATELWERVI